MTSSFQEQLAEEFSSRIASAQRRFKAASRGVLTATSPYMIGVYQIERDAACEDIAYYQAALKALKPDEASSKAQSNELSHT